VLIACAALSVLYLGVLQWDRAYGSKLTEHSLDVPPAGAPLIELATDRPDTIRLTDAGMKTVGVPTVEVQAAPPPEPLRLPGSILLDPNRMVRIHARFPGELVSVATVPKNPPTVHGRQLRFGDRVEKG